MQSGELRAGLGVGVHPALLVRGERPVQAGDAGSGLLTCRPASSAPTINGSGIASEPVALDPVSEGATHRG